MIDRLKKYFLLSFIALCPLVYSTKGLSLRDVQEIFYQFFSIIVIALFIGNVWIAAFLILNVITFLHAGADVGQTQVLNVFLAALLFMVSKAYFKKNNLTQLFYVLIGVLLLNLGWMILQKLSLDPLFSGQTNGGGLIPGSFNDPVGFFGIKMANGIFLSILIPVVAFFSVPVSLALFFPILLCQSVSAVMAGVSGILFFAYFKSKKTFLILLPIVLLGFLAVVFLDFKVDPKTFSSRFPVWHSAVRYALKNPLGYGPDSYRNFNKLKDFVFVGDSKYNHAIAKVDPEHSNANQKFLKVQYYNMNQIAMPPFGMDMKSPQVDFWDNPHNEFIQILFEYGLVGIIILGGFLREIYLRFRMSEKSTEVVVLASIILVFLVASITQFPFHLTRLAYLMPIILGSFYGRTDTV